MLVRDVDSWAAAGAPWRSEEQRTPRGAPKSDQG